MKSRLLTFDRLENFRDYGGYMTPAGPLAMGRLYRSGLHARATDHDLEKMAGLNIATIVDLRRQSERLEQPSRRPAGWTGQVLESSLGGNGEAPHIAFLKTQPLTAISARKYMGNAYAHMAYEPNHVALFKGYFQALSEGRGPVLIHCAAGKDRTGLLAALTHTLLGVNEDDLMEDYLATNQAINLEGRIDMMVQRLHKVTGRSAAPEAVVAFLGVEPDFLQNAWNAIRTKSGSRETYLQQVLGVDAAMAGTIRDNLMV